MGRSIFFGFDIYMYFQYYLGIRGGVHVLGTRYSMSNPVIEDFIEAALDLDQVEARVGRGRVKSAGSNIQNNSPHYSILLKVSAQLHRVSSSEQRRRFFNSVVSVGAFRHPPHCGTKLEHLWIHQPSLEEARMMLLPPFLPFRLRCRKLPWRPTGPSDRIRSRHLQPVACSNQWRRAGTICGGVIPSELEAAATCPRLSVPLWMSGPVRSRRPVHNPRARMVAVKGRCIRLIGLDFGQRRSRALGGNRNACGTTACRASVRSGERKSATQGGSQGASIDPAPQHPASPCSRA